MRPWMWMRTTVGLLCLSAASGITAAAEVSSPAFSQLDFLNANGDIAGENSLWGEFAFSYDPDPTAVGYLNLRVANAPGDDGLWAIRNCPLSPADGGDPSTRRATVSLDLGALGLLAGQDWAETYYEVSVDAAIRTQAPAGQLTPAVVGDAQFGDWMVTEPLEGTGFMGGRPSMIQVTAPPAPRKQTEHDLRHVDEEMWTCFVGSVARSLDWLNRHHQLGFEADAQALYRDMASTGISVRNNDKTPAEDHTDWVKKTMAYLQRSRIPMTTKVIDLDDRFAHDPAVTQQEGGDLWAWLKAEWEHGEDIELMYKWRDPATGKHGLHAVTVRDIFFSNNGDHNVIVIQDDRQGRDGSGARIQYLGVWEGFWGDYYLGSENRWVVGAVAESIPEPCTSLLMLFGAGAALGKRPNR